jgi:hypothetical protein
VGSNPNSAFLDEVIAAGWDPTAPSEECILRTGRPPMPPHLTALDKRGIHCELLDLEFLRTFPTARDESTPVGQVEAVTLLHALRSEGILLSDIGTEHFRELHAEMGRWYSERLRPSEIQFDKAVADKISHEEFAARHHEFEPAWTRNVLQLGLKVFDRAGNRDVVKQALMLCEQRGLVREADRRRLARTFEAQIFDEDVGALLPILTRTNPGRRLHDITAAGQFRLIPSAVRDALEAEVQAVEPTHEARGEPLPKDARELRAVKDHTPADEASEEDVMRVLAQVLRSARDAAAPGSPRRIVCEHLADLNSKKLSIRALAKQTGVPRRTLDRALADLRDHLGRCLDLPHP